MKHLLLVFIVAIACYTAKSQVGHLDPSFGNNGLVRTIFPSGSNKVTIVRDIFPGPGNTVYMVLSAGEITHICRHLPNGALDLSYGDNGFSVPIKMTEPGAAMQADGKIVVVGTVFITQHDFIVARFNTDGTLDNSFAGDGVQNIDVDYNDDKGKAVAVQPDGKIVVVGEANYDFTLIRYNPDGTLDYSFSEDGIASTDLYGYRDEAIGIVVQNDGKLVVAGATTFANTAHMGVARFLPDGNIDNSFSDDGKTAILVGTFRSSVDAIALQGDGKILLAGNMTDAAFSANLADFAIVRLNTDGTLDNSFSGDGKQTTDFGLLREDRGHAIVVQNDGRIVAAGFTNFNGAYAFALARYNTDGTLDNSFSGDGKVITDIGPISDVPYALTLMADGKAVAGGAAFDAGYASVRYNLDGTPDNSFDGDGIVIGGVPTGYTAFYASAVQPDGKILAAGTTLINNEYHFTVVRYNTDGSYDNSFSGDGKLLVETLSEGGNFCYAMKLQSDGKIVLGGSGRHGIEIDFAIARLNPDGSLDNSFSGDGKALVGLAGYGESVYAMDIQADGKIVVAGFTYFNYQADIVLARLNTDGTLDNSFSNDGIVMTDFGTDNDVANAMIIQPDGKIIVAGVTNYPIFDIAMARYNANGDLDPTFDLDGKLITDFFGGRDWVSAMALQSDGKIVVAGGYTDFDDDIALTRYNTDGSLDNSFSDDGKLIFDAGYSIEGADAVAIQTDGKILVGGVVHGSSKYDLAMFRFNTDGTADNSFSDDGIEVKDLGFDEDLIRSISISGNRVYAAGQSVVGNSSYGILAAYLIGATCTITASIPDAMTMTTGVNTNTVYIGYTPASDLTLSVQASGGTSPYSYSWSNGATTSSITVFPLTATTYTVTITDANGCSTTASKSVNVVDVQCGNNKVLVCKVPPGNPSNASTTCIAANAVDEQLRNGSYLGNCTQQNLITAKATAPYLQLVASPNPASNVFTLTIRSNNYEQAELIVWDVSGRLIERINVLPNTIVKIGAAYRHGVYMVEVRQGNERVSLKLLKN